jgi:hypothetical protein
MKLCRQCSEVKPLTEFYHFANGNPLHICKSCHKERMRLHRLSNPQVQERERQRSKTPERRAHLRTVAMRWRQQNPKGYRAHNAANNAVRDRKLSRQACQVCGTIEHVHKHHRDYTRPLDVTWLCAKCHRRLHVLFPELSGHL